MPKISYAFIKNCRLKKSDRHFFVFKIKLKSHLFILRKSIITRFVKGLALFFMYNVLCNPRKHITSSRPT